MSRRRKAQEIDGDRSHIPREERSYTEYHPRLLTHLALTVVQQSTQHLRRGSYKGIACRGNGRDSMSTIGHSPVRSRRAGEPQTIRTTPSTPGSVASYDLLDTRRDDVFAFGQITSNQALESMNSSPFAMSAANLFEVNPEYANAGEDALEAELVDPVIDPELLALDQETSSPAVELPVSEQVSANGESSLLTPDGRPSRIPFRDAGPSDGRTNGRALVSKPSDRFLRSEVSVEEKFERLRREEGFSIGQLHQPTFRKLDTSMNDHKVKLTSNAIAFGYQADRPFKLSQDAYTRTVDVPESELADRVEYDMDEQDDNWLTHYNAKRVDQGFDTISREIFEITLTKIEKEWTALEKRIPRIDKKEDAPVEDAKCSICDDGECENTNAIVFCDGCNLAVHQECYGVPYIPEGQWLCRRCFASPTDPVSCVFCPSKQGAFKQTSDLHWAHLLCTSWIPEVSVGNLVFMEPIEGVSNIPPSRWKLTCYICKLRVGACIQCSNKTCYTPFHVSCARRAKLFLQRDSSNLNAAPKSFCDKHTPEWYREVVDIKESLRDAQAYFAAHTDSHTGGLTMTGNPTRGQFVVSLKRSKQHAVIPAIVFTEILSYMQKFRIRSKPDFIADMCKYWSLKRRSRRGVSLLKRLQLQIEDNHIHGADDKSANDTLEFAKMLLEDLDEHQRPLLELLHDRELLKTERCQMRNAIINHIFLPLQTIITETFEQINQIDSQDTISQATSTEIFTESVPNSVAWAAISEKVRNGQYEAYQDFHDDIIKLLNDIQIAYPGNAAKEHRFINRVRDRIELVLSNSRLRTQALNLNKNNQTATAFDEDFEPNGLIITEEKPFNWANRDESPLSDIANSSELQYNEDEQSPLDTTVHGVNVDSTSLVTPTPASGNRTSRLTQARVSSTTNATPRFTASLWTCPDCGKQRELRGRPHVCPVSSAHSNGRSGDITSPNNKRKYVRQSVVNEIATERSPSVRRRSNRAKSIPDADNIPPVSPKTVNMDELENGNELALQEQKLNHTPERAERGDTRLRSSVKRVKYGL